MGDIILSEMDGGNSEKKARVVGGAIMSDVGYGGVGEDLGFNAALDDDEASVKKEMGKEGYREMQKVLKEYAGDPFMLNVKVQDMSDTLILRAFGRVRDGK